MLSLFALLQLYKNFTLLWSQLNIRRDKIKMHYFTHLI